MKTQDQNVPKSVRKKKLLKQVLADARPGQPVTSSIRYLRPSAEDLKNWLAHGFISTKTISHPPRPFEGEKGKTAHSLEYVRGEVDVELVDPPS